jgi:hypothetical protein
MTATTIDTLELAGQLREAGVAEKPAAAIAQAIKQGADSTGSPDRLAKIETDLAEFKGETRANFRWMKWGMGFIIAAIIGIVWQLIAVHQHLAALSAQMTAQSAQLINLAEQISKLTP